MVNRKRERTAITKFLARYPVVGIVGARQVGKITVARDLHWGRHGSATFFDLEDPRKPSRLSGLR